MPASASVEPEKPDWALSANEREARAQGLPEAPPPKRRWLWLVVILLLVVALALWSLRQDRAGDGAISPADNTAYMQLIPSEVTAISPTTLQESVKVTGSLTPKREVHISAEVAGRIEEVFVRAGAPVEEGQLLAQIDIETLTNQREQQRATADATEAQLRLAQAQLDRTQNLVDRGVTSAADLETGQAQVDQLTANLAALEKQVESAETSLANTRIIAPFEGMISSRSVDPGAYVGIGTELLSMVDLDELEFEANMPVRFAPSLSLGQPVSLTVEGLGNTVFHGEVDRISPVASEGTRVLPVYVGIENTDGVLRGGMFASGSIVLDQKENAIGVPYGAVLGDNLGDYVMKIVDGKIERQAVTVGPEWSGGRITEILEGLSPGDVIVSQPLEQLRPGTRVDIIGG